MQRRAKTKSPGRLLGPDLKVHRAKRHLQELESEIQNFLKGQPYEIYREDDPATEELVWKIRVHSQPPATLSTIIGDVVHNLRTALDLLAWQLVEANGRRPTKETMFPIARSENDFTSYAQRRLNGADRQALKLVEDLKPYPGGNEDLWRLHELDIADKHRVLFIVGSAYNALIIRFAMNVPGEDVPIEFPPIGIRPADRLFPLQDGADLYRVRRSDQGAQGLDNPEFTFDVAFGGGEAAQGEAVIPTLQRFADIVEKTVETFRPLLVDTTAA